MYNNMERQPLQAVKGDMQITEQHLSYEHISVSKNLQQRYICLGRKKLQENASHEKLCYLKRKRFLSNFTYNCIV